MRITRRGLLHLSAAAAAEADLGLFERLAHAAEAIATSRSNSSIDDFLADTPAEYKEGVRKTLLQAGENASALMSVRNNIDKEFSKGYYFLLSNMHHYGHVEYNQNHTPKGMNRDSQLMTAEHLEQNIRLAYQARKDFTWGQQIDETAFLNHILPYRVCEERLDSWRKFLWELKDDDDGVRICDKVKKFKNSEDAAGWINLWLAKRVKFKADSPKGPEDQSPQEILKSGVGRCEEMAGVYTAMLRTFGIPSTESMTPWWPERDGNHAWNDVYIVEKKRWECVVGCEPSKDPPYWNNGLRENLFAKVYRVCFEAPYLTDATAAYSPVGDFNVEGLQQGTFVNLCVRNGGVWRPVIMLPVKADNEGKAVLKDVGCKKPYRFIVVTSQDGKSWKPYQN